MISTQKALSSKPIGGISFIDCLQPALSLFHFNSNFCLFFILCGLHNSASGSVSVGYWAQTGFSSDHTIILAVRCRSGRELDVWGFGGRLFELFSIHLFVLILAAVHWQIYSF